MESCQSDTCTHVQHGAMHDGRRWKQSEMSSANDGVSGNAHTMGKYWSTEDSGIQSMESTMLLEPDRQTDAAYLPTRLECQEADRKEGEGACTDAWGWAQRRGDRENTCQWLP